MNRKTKAIKYLFLTKWDKHDLLCACLRNNPLCNVRKCEELELTLSPYEDIKECMKSRRYKRKDGFIRQVE